MSNFKRNQNKPQTQHALRRHRKPYSARCANCGKVLVEYEKSPQCGLCAGLAAVYGANWFEVAA